MRLLLPLLFLTTIANAQDTYTASYGYFTRSSTVYSVKDVFKMWKGDTVDLKGAFRQIVKQGNVLYLQSPLSDTLIITDQHGNLDTDTMVTMAFKGGAIAFIYKCAPEQTGAIYNYWLISYPDTRIPENTSPRYWDKKSVTLSIRQTVKQATYSN
jgi:hypothetical protein